MLGTRVALLDGGSMFAKEKQIFWECTSESLLRMPCYSILIDHKDGRYLFDTGFDLAFVLQSGTGASKVEQRPEQTIPGQLSLLGLEPGNINFVVNSHYHFDHCGGNKLCRHATTICHTNELEAVTSSDPVEAAGYSERSFMEPQPATDPEIEIYTPKFETLRGDQEIAKGIYLLETPGHTRGHYSLLVELPKRRPMLFAADACYSERAMAEGLIPASHFDRTKSYASMERLKAVALQHDAEIFYSHDPVRHQSYLKAPYWYE